jgi:hypothetical protein
VAPEGATLMIPQAAPEHPAPETAHEIAGFGFEFGSGVSVAAKLALAPVVIDGGPIRVKVKLLVKLIVAVASFAGSPVLVTLIVRFGGDGRLNGAVNIPFELIPPQAGPAQPAPFTAQINPLLGFPAERMPAWNICWAPSSIAALSGNILTPISLDMVTTTWAVFVGSAALAA